MASVRKRHLKRRNGKASGRFAWVVDFKDQTGKRRTRQFSQRKQAQEFMEKSLAEKRDGKYIHAPSSKTLAEAATLWENHLATRVKGGMRMEDATRNDYVSKTNKHILPLIGHLKLAQISSGTVHTYKDNLIDAGCSPANARKVLGVLVQLLRFCTEREMIPSNPAVGVRVERSSRIEKAANIPSREQVRDAIATAEEPLRTMLIVTAFCGIRSGELRGLRWKDIDLADGWVQINQRADYKGRIGAPKTQSSRRKIPIGPYVTNTLKEWKLKTGAADFVFPTKAGSPWIHSNLLHRHWYPHRKALKLDHLRWHDLRHFAVSSWIAQNLSPKAVMEYAGHSSIQITMDLYGHLFPEDTHHEQMAQAEGDVLGNV